MDVVKEVLKLKKEMATIKVIVRDINHGIASFNSLSHHHTRTRKQNGPAVRRVR